MKASGRQNTRYTTGCLKKLVDYLHEFSSQGFTFLITIVILQVQTLIFQIDTAHCLQSFVNLQKKNIMYIFEFSSIWRICKHYLGNSRVPGSSGIGFEVDQIQFCNVCSEQLQVVCVNFWIFHFSFQVIGILTSFSLCRKIDKREFYERVSWRKMR